MEKKKKKEKKKLLLKSQCMGLWSYGTQTCTHTGVLAKEQETSRCDHRTIKRQKSLGDSSSQDLLGVLFYHIWLAYIKCSKNTSAIDSEMECPLSSLDKLISYDHDSDIYH